MGAYQAALMLAECATIPPRSRSDVQDPDYGPHSLDDRTLIILPIAMRDSGDPGDFRLAFGQEGSGQPQASVLQNLFAAAMIDLADHVKPDLGMQLADVVVLRKDHGSVGIPGLPENQLPQSIGELSLTGDFLIWDFTGGRYVAYGRFAADVPFQAMSHAVWEIAVKQVTEDIVRNSPLLGPKLRTRDEKLERALLSPPIEFPPPHRIFIPKH